LVPKSCSIGTREFCIEFVAGRSCNKLPIKLSSIFPHETAFSSIFTREIVKFLQAKFTGINSIDTDLAKVTAPYLQYPLIMGLVLMFTILVFLLTSLYDLHALLQGRYRWGIQLAIHLLVGLLCCIPFLIPTIILQYLRSNLGNLPSWVQSQNGSVYNVCAGCFSCSIILVLVGSIGRVLSWGPSVVYSSQKNTSPESGTSRIKLQNIERDN